MSITTILLESSFRMNQSPKDFYFKDTCTYTSPSDITGLLKLTAPDGTVIYQNLDWNNPDIDMPSTDELDVCDLPLDADGNYLNGIYLLEYKIKEVGSGGTYTVLGSSAGSVGVASFEIGGNYTSIMTGGEYITIVGSSTGNNGIYQIVNSIHISATNITVIYVQEDVTASGEVYADLTLDNITIVNESYDLCQYEQPEINIDIKYDCRLSTLVSEDITEYNDTYLLGYSRTHTVTPPTGCGLIATTTTTTDETSKVIIIPPNIWTRIWTSTISNILHYEFPETDASDLFYVWDTIEGTDYVDVRCQDCTCNMIDCLDNIYQNWKTYITAGNTAKIQEYDRVIKQLSYVLPLFHIADDCGEVELKETYCADIKSLTGYLGQNCSYADDVTEEIHPYYNDNMIIATTPIILSGATGDDDNPVNVTVLVTNNTSLTKSISIHWHLEIDTGGGVYANCGYKSTTTSVNPTSSKTVADTIPYDASNGGDFKLTITNSLTDQILITTYSI